MKNLKDLSTEELLSVAIEIEHLNESQLRTFAELYSESAPELLKVFENFAEEEAEHRSMLETMWTQLFGVDSTRPTVPTDKIREYAQTLDLDDEDTDTMADDDVMNAILAAENHAYDFYVRAAEATDNTELRDLFRKLSELEQGQVKTVRDCLK